MARDTDTQYTLAGALTCLTPLHVGGFGDDPDTDLPVARDGRDRCYVPGTGLAGALRQWCRSAFDEVAVSALWGFQEGDDGHASYITVDDLFVSDAQLIPEVRDGVGIDRRTGAAAEHIKYDRAVLPRGTVLSGFTVTVELPKKLPDDLLKEVLKELQKKRPEKKYREAYEKVAADPRGCALAMLAGLKEALAAGRVRLGAAKTRGLGKVRLDNLKLTGVRTNTREGIFQLLEDTADEVSEAVIVAALRAYPPKTAPRLDIAIDWKPDGPLMVKAGYDGIAVDMLPLVSRTAGGVAPVLPGSSLKGALRNRAEQIVCTLLDIGAAPETGGQSRKRFLDDLMVPLIDELFGTRSGAAAANDRRTRGSYRHGNSNPKKLGLGALSADDCYAKTSVPVAKWDAVAAADELPLVGKKLTAEESLRAALEDAKLGSWQQAFHVAIDRWTGGAAESFLYTVLEPHAVEWEPITLTVDLDRTPPAGVALLLLVLRDLANGRLPLGFAVNRGMGAVKDVAVTVTPHGAIEYGAAPFTLAALPEFLKREWVAWLDQVPVAEVGP